MIKNYLMSSEDMVKDSLICVQLNHDTNHLMTSEDTVEDPLMNDQI